ncbi:MAG: 30S ribosome-binding factor RbfA [Candidatus Nanopelagicales bacterium]
MSKARQHKLEDRVRVIVAETLEKRVKDPRLGFITITDVRMTPDLREASIFYTVYGDAQAQDETAAALESSKGLLRSEVGRQTGIKFTPTLAFFADAMPENARHVEDLLRKAQEDDARVHEQATTAVHAGDVDPYRHPREVDDEDDEVSEDE